MPANIFAKSVTVHDKLYHVLIPEDSNNIFNNQHDAFGVESCQCWRCTAGPEDVKVAFSREFRTRVFYISDTYFHKVMIKVFMSG